MKKQLKEEVIIVDKNNNKIGTEEKLKAHEEGKLHRAFSIFVFNSKGELLIQQRAKTKYHSGGLWTNTVCSHPRPKENFQEAAHKRLKQEMGFDCKLQKLFCFICNARFKNGLTEKEYDCVFIGQFDGKPKPDPKEIDDYEWISMEDLEKDVKKNPKKYTYWFKIILNRTNYFQNKRWEIEMIEVEEQKIKTKKKFQIIDITNKIKKYVLKKKVNEGKITITTKHTTTSIRVNENEPRLFKDIKKYLTELVPEDAGYFHDDIKKRKHCPKSEPKNAPAHLRALLMGASETLPIKKGKLSLGKWQGVLFIELDGPRKRTFSMEIVANKKI